MKTLSCTLTLTLVLGPAVPASAQGPARELVGELFSIEQGENVKRFVPGVKVSVREAGNSGLTNDDGLFRVQLPPWAQPGVEVTLRHDKKGYAIASPLFGKQRLPTAATDVVEVRILPEGSKLFWTHERIEAFIAHTADEAAKKPKGPNDTGDDLSLFILELGSHYGFTPEEIRHEIAKWMATARKDVTDFRKQGMVAFAEKKFRLAGENFRRSAEENEGQAAEKLRAAAKDRELSGDSFYGGERYQEALQEYQIARKALRVYHDGLGPLGITVYPEYAAEARELSFKISNVRSILGEIVSGLEGRHHLEGAVQEFQRLIAENPRSSNAQLWAACQNGLGITLGSLGRREGGAQGLKHLREAVEACRQALIVRTRDHPGSWADTQQCLGFALWLQSNQEVDVKGVKLLEEAVEAYLQALTVLTRRDFPRQWADTQHCLGLALISLGSREEGAQGVEHLREAVEAGREALSVDMRNEFSRQWAVNQNGLSVALRSLGSREGGAEGVKHLKEAVEADRRALTVQTRDDLPQDWARTQYNLGLALESLSTRVKGSEGVKYMGEAVEAYRQTLTVYTRDEIPYYWALTQQYLGSALQDHVILIGFPTCLRQIDQIARQEGIRDDPVAEASLQTLAVVCQVGMDRSAEASRSFAGLVALVERQPDDFHLVWNWTPLRSFLARSEADAIKARRMTLLKLLDAVARENRKAILDGLKALQGEFTAKADELEKAPREP